MTSNFLILLGIAFPLLSTSAQASSYNVRLPLIHKGRGIGSWQVEFNLEEPVRQVQATSPQSSNIGVRMDLKSRKGQSFWRRRHLRNVHETLIIIGWGILLPTGVIVARYFKDFPRTPNEWYRFHVMLQSSGYILGTVGLAIGLSLGNNSKQRTYKTQRTLSIIVFVFTTIQMLAIFWHPKEEDKYHRCWQIYHRFLGYSLLALIVSNILLGIRNQSQAGEWLWVYVVILGILALIALALEIYRWKKT